MLETKNDVRREDSDCRQELRERFLCQGPGHKVTLKKGPARSEAVNHMGI